MSVAPLQCAIRQLGSHYELEVANVVFASPRSRNHLIERRGVLELDALIDPVWRREPMTAKCGQAALPGHDLSRATPIAPWRLGTDANPSPSIVAHDQTSQVIAYMLMASRALIGLVPPHGALGDRL